MRHVMIAVFLLSASCADQESISSEVAAVVAPNSILYNVEVTDYVYALEQNYQAVPFQGQGLPIAYRRDFLCSATGVPMQGTGLALDGRYIHYVSGGGGWRNNPANNAPIELNDCASARFTYVNTVTGTRGVELEPYYSVAVDPTVIPLGSYVYIDGLGRWGRADDTGPAIKGKHIDFYIGDANAQKSLPRDLCADPRKRCTALFVTNELHVPSDPPPFSTCGDGKCDSTDPFTSDKWMCPFRDGPCRKEDCGSCPSDCNCRQDAVRGCDDISNKTICRLNRGQCENGQCVKHGAEGQPSVVIGTCVDGNAFTPQARPTCNNAARVDDRCRTRCQSAGGFVRADGRCETTRLIPSINDTFAPMPSITDITAVTCIDPPGATCESLSNPDLCMALGGWCSGMWAPESCADEFWQFPLAQPASATIFGVCRTDASGPFGTGFGPRCPQPEPGIGGVIRTCRDEISHCDNTGECCAGLICGNAFNPWQQNHDGTDICLSPNGPHAMQHIGVFQSGTGTGRVDASTGASCTGSCLLDVNGSTTVSLRAFPSAGSTFAGWTGECSASFGDTCTVSTDQARGVRAVFNLGGGACRCSDKVCGSGDGCGGTCQLGASGCTLRGQWPFLFDVSGAFAPYIQGAIAAGYMTPQGPNTFGTSALVTRGEMATIIIRARLGDSFSYAPNPFFTDVPTSDWRFPYVQKLAELGITVGYGDGRFGVDDTLTRGQMAVFIMRARYGESASGPPTYSAHWLPYFGDVRENHLFFRPIQRMREDGITSGTNADPATYSPDAAIPRDQMAVFIMRAFGGPSYAPTPYTCRPSTSCAQLGLSWGTIFNGCTNVSCQ